MIGLPGWVFAVLIIIVVVLVIMGQPDDQTGLKYILSPTVLTRGAEKSYAFVSGVADDVEGYHIEAGAPTDPKKSHDTFGSDVLGGDAATKTHNDAFNADTRNRLISGILSDSVIHTPTLGQTAFQWTGTYEGQRELHANPLMRKPLVNPSVYMPNPTGCDPIGFKPHTGTRVGRY